MTRGQVPNLQLPPAPAGRGSRSAVGGLAVVLLLAVLVLQVYALRRPAGAGAGPGPTGIPAGNAERDKQRAVRLEDANLAGPAAEAWAAYLRTANLDDQEAGRIHYRIGKLRQQAGEFEQAAAAFFEAESCLGGQAGDLQREIDRRVADCLRRLGRYTDLARQIESRSAAAGPEALTGQQVVAEIGAEKMTVTDFDRQVDEEIERRVKSRLGLSPEAEDEIRRRAHQELAEPRARAAMLEQLVAARVLATEARTRGLQDSDDFRQRLASLADGILAGTLLFDEVQKRGGVTDADVERYYAAEKERYAQPAATFLAHVQCRDEAQARAVLARIHEGAVFEDIAKAESLDTTTREQGGALAEPLAAEGEMVPLVGANRQLHDQLRAAAAGTVWEEPVHSPRGWHVLKILSHRERVEKPLEEIREQVEADASAARHQEVTEQFLKELFTKSGVKLFPEVFTGAGAAGPGGTRPGGAQPGGKAVPADQSTN